MVANVNSAETPQSLRSSEVVTLPERKVLWVQ